MGKVIDIFTGEEFNEDEKGFYDRFKECYEAMKEHGSCPCDICKEKKRIAYETVIHAKNLCHTYMKDTKTKLYWGDLLDILLIASRETKNYINYKDEN